MNKNNLGFVLIAISILASAIIISQAMTSPKRLSAEDHCYHTFYKNYLESGKQDWEAARGAKGDCNF